MSKSETSIRSADDMQLEALGYASKFERSMSLWENFALGFTYLSPVVGVYSVLAFALQAGGPPMFWTYLVVGAGQLLVCMIFGEIVSQFPISGGLYPWARRLVGKRWAWMAGWVYLWALCATIAAVAVAAAPFLGRLLGFEATSLAATVIAVLSIIGTTLLNVSGTRLLARVAMIGFVCELVGAVLVGAYLLIFARNQPWSVLFDTFQFGRGVDYLPALLAASVAATFCYYGFEACGDVAEETPDPARAIPRAMRMTIFIGGGAAMFICLALILAVPDMSAAISGKDTDPVSTALTAAMGADGFKAVAAVVLVSFFSCLLSLQAAASRLLHAYARDEMIVYSAALGRLSEKERVPSAALWVCGLVPVAIAVIGYFLENALKTIIIFGSVGIYIGFQMVVLGALFARARGWEAAGRFRLGAWAWPVNIGALLFGTAAIVNLMWPRAPGEPWYINYGMVLTSVVVIGAGLFYMWLARPYDRGRAPFGDAHLIKEIRHTPPVSQQTPRQSARRSEKVL